MILFSSHFSVTVILKARVSRLLVILCKAVQKLERVYGILREVVSQKNHRKRELAIFFSFWPVFILTLSPNCY